jgi:heat shock protein HspQ
MMKINHAQYSLGHIVRHNVFGYRGVVVDVDTVFSGNEKWYEETSGFYQPPKDEPWYHILIDGLEFWAYAAESSLENDVSADPVDHPELDYFFDDFSEGVYITTRTTN